jgi:hypothetical protein
MNRNTLAGAILLGLVTFLVVLAVQSPSQQERPSQAAAVQAVGGPTIRAATPTIAEVSEGGALTSSQQVIDTVLAWLPSDQHPHDIVVRLVPEFKAGMAFGVCQGWDNTRPVWMVAALTDATWDFGWGDFAVGHSTAGRTPVPKIGVYAVYDANLGTQTAWGDLVESDNPKYDDIKALENEELLISYETPEVLEGMSAEDLTAESRHPPDVVATVNSLWDEEKKCREKWWPEPTPTPAESSQ